MRTATVYSSLPALSTMKIEVAMSLTAILKANLNHPICILQSDVNSELGNMERAQANFGNTVLKKYYGLSTSKNSACNSEQRSPF